MKKRKTKKKSPVKKTKNTYSIFLVIFLFIFSLLVFAYQSFYLVQTALISEVNKTEEETKKEIRDLKAEVDEIRIDFQEYYSQGTNQTEDQKEIAKKVRYLNYLNSHLSKTIEQYNLDFSIQFFKNYSRDLENLYREVVNIQLISNRIANKIDTLLLFDEISENQIELLEKDFDLFYEKTGLIFCN